MSGFLQNSSGDLDLTSGNLVLVLDEDTLIAQKLTNRFQLFLGEWFMDTRVGVPYFQNVFVKNPDLASIGQLFARVILQTPGVDSITSANLEFIAGQRSLTASFVIRSVNGAIIEGGLGQPFIVTQAGKGQS